MAGMSDESPQEVGHSWAIPLEGGPWTCRDIAPLSPAGFIGGKP